MFCCMYGFGGARGGAVVLMMAGSSGTDGLGGSGFGSAGASIERSLTSAARKTMNSYSWSVGAISSAGLDFRPSVPIDLTCSKLTVDAAGSMECKIPRYLMSDFEISEILDPMYC